jgi:hypothetical protein
MSRTIDLKNGLCVVRLQQFVDLVNEYDSRITSRLISDEDIELSTIFTAREALTLVDRFGLTHVKAHDVVHFTWLLHAEDLGPLTEEQTQRYYTPKESR